MVETDLDDLGGLTGWVASVIAVGLRDATAVGDHAAAGAAAVPVDRPRT